MYFSEEHGWLRYHPFDQFTLPTLHHCYNTNAKGFESGPPKQVEFRHPDDARPMFQRPLFKLEWPGTMHPKADSLNWDDDVPLSIMRHWEGAPFNGGNTVKSYPLKGYLSLIGADRELPVAVAYHAAINHQHYSCNCCEVDTPVSVHHHVGGLSMWTTTQVLQSRFALDGRTQAALTYLKWLAESHWNHPLLSGAGGFDTAVKDRMRGIAQEAIKLYFWMLGDCLFDEEQGWWDRSKGKKHWWRLAAYLFWTGRAPYAITGAPEYADWTDNQFMKDMPECIARHQDFVRNNYNRALAHVTGKDPAQQESPEVTPEA